MTKFRRNHNKSGNSFSTTIIRVVAFLLIGGFALAYISNSINPETAVLDDNNTVYEVPPADNPDERFYIPISSSQAIIHHENYSLAYSEKHEQAEWVAYELRRDQLKLPNVKREREFRPDYKVKSRSAFHRDYTRSGYTRGHLAPAGDMAFNEVAMKESFFMSNMSPQLEAFNGGIWRELEETIRDWAYKEGRLYVATGPILNQEIIKKIGDNKVSVPKYFYKVILDFQQPEHKAIGFIIENNRSDIHLREYAVTVDEVERQTGIDFFPDLMLDELEEEIESTLEINKWKFDNRKFKERNRRYDN